MSGATNGAVAGGSHPSPAGPPGRFPIQSGSWAALSECLRQIRNATDIASVRFRTLNSTKPGLDFSQSLWVEFNGSDIRVKAASGVVAVDPSAPFIRWVCSVADHLRQNNSRQIIALDPRSDLPASLKSDWSNWSFPYVLWCPFPPAPGKEVPCADCYPEGGLWIMRTAPWTEEDARKAEHIASTAAHAIAALAKPERSGLPDMATLLTRMRGRKGRYGLAAALTALLIATFPVRHSALAPAEIIADEPTVVTAPIDGVVDRIHVKPNQSVKEGDILFTYDPKPLDNKVQLAEESYRIALSELKQATQGAFATPESKAQLASLQARAELERVRRDYAVDVRQRATVKATRPGIVLFEKEPQEWVGKPVQIGEKVAELAAPDRAKVRVWLPVADTRVMEDGAEVELFLDTRPLSPLHATLERASYRAEEHLTGQLAYRLTATLKDPGTELSSAETAPRIGLQGTAKVYGPKTVLFMYVMHKPIAALRRFFTSPW